MEKKKGSKDVVLTQTRWYEHPCKRFYFNLPPNLITQLYGNKIFDAASKTLSCKKLKIQSKVGLMLRLLHTKTFAHTKTGVCKHVQIWVKGILLLQRITWNVRPVTWNVRPVIWNVRPVILNVWPVIWNVRPVIWNVRPVILATTRCSQPLVAISNEWLRHHQRWLRRTHGRAGSGFFSLFH